MNKVLNEVTMMTMIDDARGVVCSHFQTTRRWVIDVDYTLTAAFWTLPLATVAVAMVTNDNIRAVGRVSASRAVHLTDAHASPLPGSASGDALRTSAFAIPFFPLVSLP